jgi:hypothetical protein
MPFFMPEPGVPRNPLGLVDGLAGMLAAAAEVHWQGKI